MLPYIPVLNINIHIIQYSTVYTKTLNSVYEYISLVQQSNSPTVQHTNYKIHVDSIKAAISYRFDILSLPLSKQSILRFIVVLLDNHGSSSQGGINNSVPLFS